MIRIILASLLSLTILTPDSDGMGGRRAAFATSCNHAAVTLVAAPAVQYTQLQTYFVPTTQVQFEYVQPTIEVQLPPPAVTFSYQQPTVQLQTAPTYAPPVQLRQRVQLQNVYATPAVQLRGRVSASAYVAAAPPRSSSAVLLVAKAPRKGLLQKFRERKAGRHASRAGGAFVPGR